MKRTIRITSMLLAIVMAVSFSACNDQTAVSRTDSNATGTTISSNVDSAEVSSDTETSKEETSSGTSSSKSETSSDTDSSESSATTTAVTTTTAKTTTTNSTSSPKEEKTEEREVYDEDGNVVDKIKVKVVDGVAYTVGQKDEMVILEGAPLIPNGKKYPSGTAISCVTMLLQFYGENVTQDDVANMYTFYSESDWYYGEDGRFYGPEKSPFTLLSDPKIKSEIYYSDVAPIEVAGIAERYCEKYSNIKYSLFKYSRIVDTFKVLQQTIEDNDLLSISVRSGKKDIITKKWIAKCENGTERLIEVSTQYFACMLIGYKGEYIYVYDPFYDTIFKYYYDPVKLIKNVNGIEKE